MTRFAKVNVIGLGYVGLPTAAVLATSGMDVIGVDVDQAAIESINAGKPHFVEAALDTLLQAVVTTGKLRATDKPEPADCHIIAVPTPIEDATHQADLSFVAAAAKSIAPLLKAGNLVILESTSPVGTTERICQIMAMERPDLAFPTGNHEQIDVHVAHCPERVMPGHVLRELIENDRIIGGISISCGENAREFYRSFVEGKCVLTDARTAELAKLAENAYRDVNIAFANELANVCDVSDVDVWELIRLANRHPRVNVLQPGPGVGGHCIAVDPWFVISNAPNEAPLMQAARHVNDQRPLRIAEKIRAAARGNENACVACLGLAFKPDVDDLRNSPAVEIVAALAKGTSGEVLVVEPHISKLPPALRSLPNLRLVELSEAIDQADIIALLVHHRAFVEIDRTRLLGKTVIDTRGVWQ